jgi:hypothetical protein
MPMLMVCSARRPMSLAQAEAFAQRAKALGADVRVLAIDLSHAQINAQAGADGALTRALDAFVTEALDGAGTRADRGDAACEPHDGDPGRSS